MNHNQIRLYRGRPFAILLVLFSFLFFSPVAARTGPTRHVAPTGSDAANNCLAVRNPCATVTHAISQADPGDTIRLAPGVYTETNIQINKSLTIAGQQATNTFLQGAESMETAVDPVLIIGQDDMETQAIDVTLQNLTIRHGRDASDGYLIRGAITVWPISAPASLTLVGVAVEANQGSGIGIGYSVLTLRQSRVSHNQGNGISGYDANIYILESSEIAANNGRGMLVEASEIAVEWSEIRDNSNSGVESWGDDQITVRNSRLLGNGGAAVLGSISGTYIDVADSVISGNGSGLGVQIDGQITVSNSIIRSNRGGAIGSERSNTYVDNSMIENNGGGGIYHANNTNYWLQVSDSVIRGNTGYGLYLWQTRGSVSNTTISGNQAGGLHADREVQLYVSNSHIIRNRSSLNGGGVFNRGDLTLVNTLISQNQAAQHGGGIYSEPGYDGHNLQLIGVTVTQNYADTLRNNAGNGGGIYNQDWAALTLLDTSLTSNFDLSPTERHPNCSGGLTSLGGNTFGDLTGCTVIEE